MFAYTSAFDGIWSSPVAGFLTDGGFSGLSVVGWFPLAEHLAPIRKRIVPLPTLKDLPKRNK